MMIDIQIDVTDKAEIDTIWLQAILTRSLKHCQVEMGELSIVITDDETIKALNQQYLGINTPTDVLSFANQDESLPFISPISGQTSTFVDGSAFQHPPYLGDIIISQPTALRQAEESGHQMMEEIVLLAIHGLLHLLGYAHYTPEQKKIMWQQQSALLRLAGLSHVKPSET